jgi:ATP-dependent RNA circularization protein (DNA/RNA ligase family)
MTDFIRFPHTPHLAWLGKGTPRGDKVLAPAEVNQLLSGVVVVEEKVDGANLGFSVDEHGAVRAQSRGSYVDTELPSGQWKPLKRWLSSRHRLIADTLTPGLILFGEWCYAVHSIRYTRLPDWFLAFDVFDRTREEFWSAARRDRLCAELDVVTVPRLGQGRYGLTELERLLDASRLTDGPAEGIYVRRETAARLEQRAKLVRPEFVQAIETHWSKRRLEPNQLAVGPERNPPRGRVGDRHND